MPPTPLVSLRPVSRDTVRDICKLKVSPDQEKLVAPNAFSIAQAYFHPEAWFRAIYAGDTPVGFAMLEDWSQVPDCEPQLYQGESYVSLWRFMIDAQHQKQGYGEEALRLLIAHARTRPRAKNMVLSFVPSDGNAEHFYNRLGFARTGEEDMGELIMKLPLD